MKRFVRPAAREDMQRQFRYYLVELDVPEVALRFLDSVEDAIRVIIRNPGIGSQRPFPNGPSLMASSGVRRYPCLLRADSRRPSDCAGSARQPRSGAHSQERRQHERLSRWPAMCGLHPLSQKNNNRRCAHRGVLAGERKGARLPIDSKAAMASPPRLQRAAGWRRTRIARPARRAPPK